MLGLTNFRGGRVTNVTNNTGGQFGRDGFRKFTKTEAAKSAFDLVKSKW